MLLLVPATVAKGVKEAVVTQSKVVRRRVSTKGVMEWVMCLPRSHSP